MSGAPFLLIDAGNSRVKWALVRRTARRCMRGRLRMAAWLGMALLDATLAHRTAHDDPDWSSNCRSPPAHGFPT